MKCIHRKMLDKSNSHGWNARTVYEKSNAIRRLYWCKTSENNLPSPTHARVASTTDSSERYTDGRAYLVVIEAYLSVRLLSRTVMTWMADVVRMECPRSSESVTTKTSDVPSPAYPSNVAVAAPVLRFHAHER